MVSKNYYIVSLGCPKNLVDSEEVAGLLASRGWSIVQDPGEADVLIVNTCAFIREAVEETIDTILELEKFKKSSRNARLAVIGCFVQRFGKKLPRLFPEADIFLGTGFFHHFPDALKENLRTGRKVFKINRPVNVTTNQIPRLLSGPGYTAYVKITEGCSNSCTFCMIPRLRGPQRSRPLESIVSEVGSLVERGTREIILVGQDTTSYGADFGSSWLLVTLLEKLAMIPKISWIRMMYLHPSGITDDLLRVVNEYPPILPYFDVPLQHVVPRILKKMGREYEESPRKLVERIREKVPSAALRTSLMVGFPGESTRDFKKLLGFVEWAQFDRLGVFGYSREAGTRSYLMRPRVRGSTIARRRDEILALQAEISMKKHERLIGSLQVALVEERPGGAEPGRGRLWSQAPEIDGEFFFTGDFLRPGDITTFRITSAGTYDLEGIPAGKSKKSNKGADSF